MISALFIEDSWAALNDHHSVFGAVLHTKDADVAQLEEWLQKLRSIESSIDFVTVKDAVELLPTEHLSAELYEQVYPE